MKKIVLYYSLVFVAFVAFGSWILYPTGSPGGKTGSPGDGGATCVDCHIGTPQPVEGWLSSDIPVEGYLPGQTYTITATGTHTGVVKFGFEATAENSAGTKNGTMIITNADQTRLVNANRAVTHTVSGTTPFGNSKSWSFDWTAPDEGTGDITFYAAFNAANGNGAPTGDVIYTSSLSVMESVASQNNLIVSFTGMNPHVGEMLGARLINKYDLMETDRVIVESIPSPDFEITFENVEDGNSYFIDIFADHNGNGLYDPPTTDHAWRIDAEDISVGETINFSHNTSFTDIHWRYMLTMDLTGMVPHIGEFFEARLLNINRNLKEVGRVSVAAIQGSEFTVKLPCLEYGHSYYLEFYADHNNNGQFDPVPADHAWRLEAMEVPGDQSLQFSHNTNFDELDWKNTLKVEFSGMTPHLGQELMVRVLQSSSGNEAGRTYRTIDMSNIAVIIPGLSNGEDFLVDFFTDHNGNGKYDAPPEDHAWRLEATDVSGNTMIPFSHNTSFIDIGWKYMATLHAMGMFPHIGQMVELRMYDTQTATDIGLVTIENLMVPEIFIEFPGSEYNVDYNIDFYADHNFSGGYDPPPTDHAWRIELLPVLTDSIVEFTHNTNFTNINWPVQVTENIADKIGLRIYPNPASDFVMLDWSDSRYEIRELKIYSISGAMVGNFTISRNERIYIQELLQGIYYLVPVFSNGERAFLPVIKR